MAARTLMIQGTASHVGKSIMTAALCRLFTRQGLRVAPFKAQNMSNNSCVTPEGREIGRAQAVQAAACRVPPRSDFNPVLIKPSGEKTAQLVVDGRVAGFLSARDFGRIRQEHFPAVCEALDRLRAEFDLVILEGAGSPAEINLSEHDIVNMRMARAAAAPVLLVGDIDRGGVFAALIGTLALLQPDERRYVKGFLINKFRGDLDLLRPGIRMLEAQASVKCFGVIPHWTGMRLPEEDSLGWETRSGVEPVDADPLTIGVADVPTLSNSTDYELLTREPDVRVIKVHDDVSLPLDVLIFPGAKNTADALRWITSRGLDRTARRVRADGGTIIGICGGYQILGRTLRDSHGGELGTAEVEGLGLLDVVTSFARKKVTVQVIGIHRGTRCPVHGYEVHMGRTKMGPGVMPLLDLEKPDQSVRWSEGAVSPDGRVWGTYVHGLFDAPLFRRAFLNGLRVRKGWAPLFPQPGASLDEDLDALTDFVKQHIDLAEITEVIAHGV